MTETTRPYPVSTRTILPGGPRPYLGGDQGTLIEVPQTCKIDWMVSADDMKAIFRDHEELAGRGLTTAVTFALHEEHAATYAPKFDEALRFVDGRIEAGTVLVRYATVSEIRSAFLEILRAPPSKAEAVARLEELGVVVLQKDGRVRELVGNRSRMNDDALRLIASFGELTDLSLEETSVSDAGMQHVASLPKLEWLALYKTRVGDEGLGHLKRLTSLRHLPIGETRVTDAGLVHVAEMRELVYLGLRADAISDAGLVHLGKLDKLRGLHLGETRITDAGLRSVAKLEKLERLWLHDTEITDAAVPQLARLQDLRELYIYRTHLTVAGVRELGEKLPTCRVFYRSATKPE